MVVFAKLHEKSLSSVVGRDVMHWVGIRKSDLGVRNS
jgi:hypothetical protein